MQKRCFLRPESTIFAKRPVSAQTAADVSKRSAEKSTALESIEYIKKQSAEIKNFAEKRSLLAFLGSLQEQLGLFREENNAKALVETLSKKGFTAHIMSETKPSGNKYYIVFVGDDDNYTIGKKLKAAGFDCYPIK